MEVSGEAAVAVNMGIIKDGGNVRGGGAVWSSPQAGHEENNSYIGDGFVCNDGDKIG